MPQNTPETNSVAPTPELQVQPSDLLNMRIDVLREEVIAPLVAQDGFNFMQQETLSRLNANLAKDQLVDLPTRSGKSHMIRHIAAQASRQGLRTVIITHRTHIKDEHEASLIKLCGEQPDSIFNETPGLVTVDTISKLLRRNLGKEEVQEHENVDLVLIDEAHRALGEKTRPTIRKSFPDSVRIAFTATPDFSEDRSATHEYGDKIVSHSPVEAIETGIASPLRAFVYKTEGIIDDLDPAFADFSPRELKRLADFLARNRVIADMAEDLLKDGRQGIISTIPGENLLHADRLKSLLEKRYVKRPGEIPRPIRAEVIKGSQPAKTNAQLESFEDGYTDVLLFCDVLTEGWTSERASFFINGRPTTSIVNLTQQIGRIMQPKDTEGVAIDFVDSSVGKKQRTLLEVLELDRAVQGVRIGPAGENTSDPEDEPIVPGDTYMRGLFRFAISEEMAVINNLKIAELLYTRRELEELTPHEKALRLFRQDQAREFRRQSARWGRILRVAGLREIQPDYLGYEFYQLPDLRKRSATFLENNDLALPEGTELIADPAVFKSAKELGMLGVYGRNESSALYLPVIPASPVIESWSRSSSTNTSRLLKETEDLINLPEQIAAVLGELSEREQETIRMRFGLEGGQAKTLEEVAEEYGVTRERIRQIEAKTLARLRHPMRSGRLRSYVWSDYDKSNGPGRRYHDFFPAPPTPEMIEARNLADQGARQAKEAALGRFGVLYQEAADRSAATIVETIKKVIPRNNRHGRIVGVLDQQEFTEEVAASLLKNLFDAFNVIKSRGRTGYYDEDPEIKAEKFVGALLRGMSPKSKNFIEGLPEVAGHAINQVVNVQPRYFDPHILASQIARKMLEKDNLWQYYMQPRNKSSK